MKTAAANFTTKFCSLLKDKCAGAMKKVAVSLTDNLKHQHTKVRLASLEGLKQVIVSRNEDALIDSIAQLKMTGND
jgi:hypothetical protein